MKTLFSKPLIAGLTFGIAQVVCGQVMVEHALARTDVPAKLEQLKENAPASQANLEQYEQGLKTVLANLKETDRALKTIEKQKAAIQKQTGQAAKDKETVDSAKQEVETYLSAERDLLVTEERQLEELKTAIAKLEENRVKRLANIAAYDEKLKSIESEKLGSTERSQSVNELDLALKKQEELVRAEQSRLSAKKAEYEAEIEKWKKQVRVSQRSVANFSRLKPQ